MTIASQVRKALGQGIGSVLGVGHDHQHEDAEVFMLELRVIYITCDIEMKVKNHNVYIHVMKNSTRNFDKLYIFRVNA